MKDKIKEMLEDIDNKECYYVGTNGCLYQDLTKEQLLLIKNYITNLQAIADNRMNTILKIEKYCIDEKEDLISGGEVCEDILKIIDELKGK